jgi:hypothetical protein
MYYIHELRNLDNVTPATPYQGTLRGAKLFATRNQTWAGTTLKITDEQGRRVATKGDGPWVHWED